jgi:hypothetical protein
VLYFVTGGQIGRAFRFLERNREVKEESGGGTYQHNTATTVQLLQQRKTVFTEESITTGMH